MKTASSKSSASASNFILPSQSAFEYHLVKMLIEDMQPLATVERRGFKRFCSLFLPRYSLPSRRKATRRLHELYEEEKAKLIDSLVKVRWVSATADIWSAHRRAYMGVTLHYVDPDTLTMVSSTLACRRFKGAHTGEQIAKCLASIFKEFKIESKLQNVVTDNAANFAKAFTLYQQTDREDIDESDSVNVLNVSESLDTVESVLHDDDSDSDGDRLSLPPHKRCGNHSLNLVASADALKARDDKPFQRSYDRVMAKIQSLWNAVSRSPKQSDIVEEFSSKCFIQPTCTRWCSEYYAVERIIDIGFASVVNCQEALGLVPMTEADMKFLNAFLQIMKPLVTAMKILEGETECYIGLVIPTIMGVQKRLQSNVEPLMKPLTKALIDGLAARFGKVMRSDDYRMASVLHPKFKLAFLSDDEKMRYKQLLVSYVDNIRREVHVAQTSPAVSTPSQMMPRDSDDDDLYSFLNKPQTSVSTDVAQQVDGFLASTLPAIGSLHAFPLVAQAFQKSNSTLPSSAAVERLFSAASQILSNRRCRMSDETFDQLLFLRSRLSLDGDSVFTDE